MPTDREDIYTNWNQSPVHIWQRYRTIPCTRIFTFQAPTHHSNNCTKTKLTTTINNLQDINEVKTMSRGIKKGQSESQSNYKRIPTTHFKWQETTFTSSIAKNWSKGKVAKPSLPNIHLSTLRNVVQRGVGFLLGFFVFIALVVVLILTPLASPLLNPQPECLWSST